jgi:hypothetical protein
MIRKSIILSMTAALLALSPTGLVFAQGGGGGGGGGGAGAGSAGGGTGAAGMGSAAVGGGAPAGSVGGGPPAGRVGGGAPGTNDPAGNGAAGTGYPSLNAAGQRAVPPSNPASGLENAPTTGGVIGGNIGVPAGGGPASPPVTGQTQADPASPSRFEHVAEQPPSSTVGRAVSGPDGVSTRIVSPRPCGTAAHETDGTTTCVGIPARR